MSSPEIIDAQNKPAFAAPASPIAKVATGIPFGICTIDNNESLPERALDLTGTPITGKLVNEATIQGKWAAPPAPAIIHSNPDCEADLAYEYIRAGVRCADTMVNS